jgi:hypothetical protein
MPSSKTETFAAIAKISKGSNKINAALYKAVKRFPFEHIVGQ